MKRDYFKELGFEGNINSINDRIRAYRKALAEGYSTLVEEMRQDLIYMKGVDGEFTLKESIKNDIFELASELLQDLEYILSLDSNEKAQILELALNKGQLKIVLELINNLEYIQDISPSKREIIFLVAADLPEIILEMAKNQVYMKNIIAAIKGNVLAHIIFADHFDIAIELLKITSYIEGISNNSRSITLNIAVDKGQLRIVQEMINNLDYMKDINVLYKWFAFYYAINKQHFEIAQEMLKNPEYMEWISLKDIAVTLNEAVEKRDANLSKKLLQEILQDLLNMQNISAEDRGDILSQLPNTNCPEIILLMIRNPAYMNGITDEDRAKTFNLLVEKSYIETYIEIITEMINSQAYMEDIPKEDKSRAFLTTASMGYIKTLEIMLDNPDYIKDITNIIKNAALYNALFYGHYEIVQMFLKKPELMKDLELSKTVTKLISGKEGELYGLILLCQAKQDINLLEIITKFNSKSEELYQLILSIGEEKDINPIEKENSKFFAKMFFKILYKYNEKQLLEIVEYLSTLPELAKELGIDINNEKITVDSLKTCAKTILQSNDELWKTFQKETQEYFREENIQKINLIKATSKAARIDASKFIPELEIILDVVKHNMIEDNILGKGKLNKYEDWRQLVSMRNKIKEQENSK